MITLMLIALAFFAAGPAGPARAYDDNRIGFAHEREPRQDPAQDFRRWADKSVAKLHRDFAETASHIGAAPPRGRRQADARLDQLQRRLTEVQGRVVHVGPSNSSDAWKERREIRTELKGIRRDYKSLREELRER